MILDCFVRKRERTGTEAQATSRSAALQRTTHARVVQSGRPRKSDEPTVAAIAFCIESAAPALIMQAQSIDR